MYFKLQRLQEKWDEESSLRMLHFEKFSLMEPVIPNRRVRFLNIIHCKITSKQYQITQKLLNDFQTNILIGLFN